MDPLPQPMSLREIFGILRRQWPSVCVIALICFGLSIAYALTAAPVFQSRTTILVEGPENRPSNDPVSAVDIQSIQRDIQTQIEILQSTSLINDAYRLANIDVPTIAQRPDAASIIPTLRAEPVGDTSVLRIVVESGNPDYARQMAEAVPKVYLGYVRTSRRSELENALKFLQARLSEEKKGLDQADAELLRFKSQRKLLPLEGEGTLRSSKAADADSSLADLDAQVAAAQERIRALQDAKAKVPPTLRTPTTEANTNLIEQQKSKISELRAQRSALLVQYLPDNPKIQEVDRQILDAEKRLAQLPKEADATRETVHPDLLSYDEKIADARAQLRSIQAQRQKLLSWAGSTQQDLKHYNAVVPEQDKLVRAVDDRKKSIDSITARIEELNVKRASVRDPVTVLTPASGAAKIRPKPEQAIVFGLLFGLVLGVGFAFLKDSIDDRVASPDEIARLTGLPLLGEVYPLPRRAQGASLASMNGKFRERYRVLRFNLERELAEHPTRTILVTSSGRAEGKTEVACSLALAMAEGGSRTVTLVDSDFRWSSVHKVMRLKQEPGFGEVILGQAKLEDVLQQGPVPGMLVMSSGAATSNPVDLLALPAMQNVSTDLAAQNELVIFDVPGAIGLADAQVLSRAIGSAIYVVKIGRTKRSHLRKGTEQLGQLGVHLIGVVAMAEKPAKRRGA